MLLFLLISFLPPGLIPGMSRRNGFVVRLPGKQVPNQRRAPRSDGAEVGPRDSSLGRAGKC
jgi:hypothetical protein